MENNKGGYMIFLQFFQDAIIHGNIKDVYWKTNPMRQDDEEYHLLTDELYKSNHQEYMRIYEKLKKYGDVIEVEVIPWWKKEDSLR